MHDKPHGHPGARRLIALDAIASGEVHMVRRTVTLRRFVVGPIGLLVGAGWLSPASVVADVAISVVDATPTARHDGTLAGIGQTIFSADVHVELTPGDAWLAGAVWVYPRTRMPGVYLYYSPDPNTGDPQITAPGFGSDAQMFGTFVSLPLPQSERPRYSAAGVPRLDGAYWGAPAPLVSRYHLDVIYSEHPFTFTQTDGFTQRLTIDVSESVYAGCAVYASTSGPRDPADPMLIGFGSVAVSSESAPSDVLQDWGFYASVPEPGSSLLFVLVLSGPVLWARTVRPMAG